MSSTTNGPAPSADDGFRTRPGTPMIGPYSAAQMDDFHAALSHGEVKPTGVMNLLQRLFIAQRCRPGDRLVDVCCGRGLQLPVLARYRPDLGHYLGLDVSPDNLAEGRARAAMNPAPFAVEFVHADVSKPWPAVGPFDVAVYTSALEHLPREAGLASLRRTAAALVDGGRLFLSTPNTPGPPPRRLQHRVHVYEWSHQDLLDVLPALGLMVDDVVGILPPVDPSTTLTAVAERFGPGGAEFYRALERHAPPALLGPVVSTALDGAASEVLYACTKRTSS
ncbi:MAG: class I SAM-dependent methyltransferase [Pseudonocardia sp.]|nr:class I SAM-dependent methyltransferase [Pseudonocardia sp.]